MQFNVCFRDGDAVSIKHVNHDAKPPKAAKWWFKMDGSTAYLDRKTIGTNRVDDGYVDRIREGLLELPFVQAVTLEELEQ